MTEPDGPYVLERLAPGHDARHAAGLARELAELAESTFVEAYVDQLDEHVLRVYAEEVFVPALLTELEARGSTVLLVRDQGQAVAYATVRVPAEDPTTLRLDRIYVRSEHSRRGLGRRLMLAAVARGREVGVSGVQLGVWEANLPAIAFYTTMGFVPCGEETFRLHDVEQRDVVMCLALT